MQSDLIAGHDDKEHLIGDATESYRAILVRQWGVIYN